MLLHDSQDESDIVYRTWRNSVTTQVREYKANWEITCFANLNGHEISVVNLFSSENTFDEMIEEANAITDRIAVNADMMVFVICGYAEEMVKRCQTKLRPDSAKALAELSAWGMKRLEKDLRSGHVKPFEIIDHVTAFLDDLQMKIDDEMALDQ